MSMTGKPNLTPSVPARISFLQTPTTSITPFNMEGALPNMPPLQQSMSKNAIRNRRKRANEQATKDENASPLVLSPYY